MPIDHLKFLLILLPVLAAPGALPAQEHAAAPAQALEAGAAYNGVWVFDQAGSDNTDRQVEKAIKAAGGKKLRGKSGPDKYRGGPPEQALYDALSYDKVIQITVDGPQVQIKYPNDLQREFFTDNRPRSVSANDSKVKDYSFASLQGERMLVESRPRDGGHIHEEYTLLANGRRLRIDMLLQPSNFGEQIHLVRYFNKYDEVTSGRLKE